MSEWDQFPDADAEGGGWDQFPAAPESPRAGGSSYQPGKILDWATRAMGGAEIAANIGTAAVARPIAGLAGIVQGVNPWAEEGAAAEAVRGVESALVYQPREAGRAVIGEVAENVAPMARAVGEYIPDPVADAAKGAYSSIEQSPEAVAREYGPMAGAAAKTLPTAILEALPMASVAKKSRAAVKAGSAPATVKARVAPTLGPDDISPSRASYERVRENLRSGKPKRIVPDVSPDADTIAAAERIGVKPIPSATSKNLTYIDAEQAMKSRPGSTLAAMEAKSLDDLQAAADRMIRDFGGTKDKSLLDASVKGEFGSIVSRLESASDEAYRVVEKAIPPATRVQPNGIRAHLASKLDDLGGRKDLLTSAEKKAMRLTQDGDPTYAALDRVRKDIGNALGKKSGPYKDDDAGVLKQLYSSLADDQRRIAEASGVGDEYSAATALVRQRKGVEDAAISLLGKEVSGSIIPKLKSGASALTKGDVSKVRDLFNALPANMRQQAAATMLNDIFTMGSRNPKALGGGFTSAYKSLTENPSLRFEIFKHLPRDAWQRFDDIGKVATGIYRALGRENTSKTARDVIAAMDDGGLLRRMYHAGAQIAVAEGVGTSVGLPGAGTAAVLGATLAKSRKPATEVADKLLTSPAFQKAIEAYAVGDVRRAASVLNGSGAFKRWLSIQPANVQKEVAAVGLIPFLTTPGETAIEPQEPQAESSGL